jgi:hypothetical protein
VPCGLRALLAVPGGGPVCGLVSAISLVAVAVACPSMIARAARRRAAEDPVQPSEAGAGMRG